MFSRNTLALVFVVCVRAFSQSPIDLPKAQRYFSEFHEVCSADNGRLWGASLCGPMLLADPATRFAVANQSDQSGVLKPEGQLFTGKVPVSQNIANTSVSWDKVLWSEIVWPLPEDSEKRSVLMAHESFHRLQKQLNLPVIEADNHHLDTLQGRYWMRLEFRALAAALRSTGKEREQAVRDAFAFRAARGNLFHLGAKDEFALESNEGLAEYTGVKIGIADPAKQIAYAIQDLADGEAQPSYVRSFAYATGPAYGLLLDQINVDWRSSASKNVPAVNLLADAIRFNAWSVVKAAAQPAASRYGGEGIWKEEVSREAENNKKKTEYRAQLVDGPVLRIPLQKMNIEFDPNRLFPLDDLGTVYPKLRISDVWGVLDVTHGAALVSQQWNLVTVPAASQNALEGEGWKLELNPGYKLMPGERKGDWVVGKSTSN